MKCPDCQETYTETVKHFCPRCAKCNAVIEADVKHVCQEPKLLKVNKTQLRKPMAKGGILGMRIKIGKLHCVIRSGVGGQLTLHPIGLEP